MFSSLQDDLLNLPDPILLVGNKTPDGDSCSSLATTLDFLRVNNKEAYIYFAETPSKSFRWMFDPGDFCQSILDDYNSLVVVDDYVCSRRLGLKSIKNVPIVNIDHHMRSDVAEGRSYYVGEVDFEGRAITLYWSKVPATACIFIDANIIHPLLWVGLATDTNFFSVNNITISEYVYRLSKKLESSGQKLRDSEVEGMRQKLLPVQEQEALDCLIGAKVNFFTGIYKGRPLQLILAEVDSLHSEHAKSSLSVYRRFADIVAVINTRTSKVSLRSSSNAFPVLDIAQAFGGGGHLHACGCTLEGDSLSPNIERLQDMLLSNLTSVETIIYN